MDLGLLFTYRYAFGLSWHAQAVLTPALVENYAFWKTSNNALLALLAWIMKSD